VEVVPTANLVRELGDQRTEAHNLDKISRRLRSDRRMVSRSTWCEQDHSYSRSEAPKVIARFGSMVNLVTQVLEPTIGNYFRNAQVLIFDSCGRVANDRMPKRSSALTDYSV
jgi:uncharacterized membrane protein YqiK